MPLQSRTDLIVTEPRVFVVACQMLYRPGLAEFLESEGVADWDSDAPTAGDMLPEIAGRLCYHSFKAGRKSNREFIGNILDEGHGSVIEHAVITFIVTGVSRTLSHELVRHRAGWGYSQLSQRYVDETNAQYVMPWIVSKFDDARELWTSIVNRQHADYVAIKECLSRNLDYDPPASKFVKLRTALVKLVNGAARSVLPGATETKLCCTVNARALRHFIEQRANEKADPEIRAFAVKLHAIASKFMPNILGDYSTDYDGMGLPYLTTRTRKV